jgi:PAS domain S-box-containing protein
MRKILMIDDEEDIRRVLAMSLRSDGYDVATAENGHQGVEVFKQERPQIVLTDIRMPGMDGLEVLKQIKKLTHDAEVIIITGHGDIDSAVEALQHGASDFIHKPVKNEALSIALKRAEEKLQIRQQLREYTRDLETMVKMATEEFERKSNFQAKLIRSSHDGIVASDEEGKILIFNPGAERIFGYKRTEVVRVREASEFFPPEVADLFDLPAGNGKGHDEVALREIWVTSKSGEKIPVRFSGTILREKSEVMGSVAFLQDLREIKRLERELVNSERLAAIGQTVAGMAHCIKNILHGFKGGSYLVDIGIDKHNTDKLIKGWQMIKRSIGRTSDLVLDLLSYSKEREPEYEPCSPNEIANDVAELLAEQANNFEIELVKNFSPSIVTVAMDPRTVHRCLLNLVSNAIDACIFDENLKKHHYVSIGTFPEAGCFIRFEVSDNGSGMSKEVTDKLFTAFFSTKGAKGTGLGMLVTCKLIEEHQGTISVQSEAGRGTTFTMRLPYQTLAQALR